MPTAVLSRFQAHLPASVRCFRQGYSLSSLRSDLLSGLTVGIVALPLSMAFAIASGTTPERGLFTAIVAGIVISLLGGSRFQIGGPTGAFVVIIAGVIARHGYEGLVLATLLAGAGLVVLGMLGFGKLLKFIPYPVITGFTAGIGVLIFTTQIKDFFGLSIENIPADFPGRVRACFAAMPGFDHTSLWLGAATMLSMLLIRRFVPRIPAPIVGIVVATAAAWAFGLDVETIGTRFGGIPASLPHFSLPSGFAPHIREVIPDAMTLMLLAGIESLLSAVVADGMTGDRHDASTELVAQGLANLGSVLFGGIPATGAIARTATNIRAGAQTPLSGVIHSLSLVAFMLACAPLASHIPLTSLAAVLMIVAWDMSEAHRFRRLLRAPKSDSAVMLITFLLTVFVDLTVAVEVGVVLAAMLFMRRMSDLSGIEPVNQCLLPVVRGVADAGHRLPKTVVYEISGPMFFGMAQRFIDVMRFTRQAPEAIVLHMAQVPSIDATGEEALKSVVRQGHARGIRMVLSGVQPRVRAVFERMGTRQLLGAENIFPDLATAMAAIEAPDQGAGQDTDQG
ncbi:SulP family inorganic anion transporter [Paucidesulfovibrio longus]|uniref:SulP family inorganic anion transporter n=1 Tax=Paucidesulfovibrio longus TaxID=889 RepID=UPI0004098FEF|nr:SulP family inorganic anion transporter [Paucidesulfovibrio longus]